MSLSIHLARSARVVAGRALPFAFLVALLAAPGFADAQRKEKVPDRPRLGGDADTNDARAYFNYGVKQFSDAPEEAADAFYWATRIDPMMGEAFYARRAALLLTDTRLLGRYMNGDRSTLESSKVRALDSLQLRAVLLDPFLYRRLDRRMLIAFYRETFLREERMSGNSDVSKLDMEYAVENWLGRSSDNGMRAWLAYGAGDFPRALEYYAKVDGKYRAGTRLDRATIFYRLGQADSALAEVRAALAEMRKRDAKELVVLYNSKAAAEYMIGRILETKDDTTGAREAYGRALQEDLSFYPAHLQLALMALTARDTATVRAEFGLATQAAPNEPHVHFLYGFALARLAHDAEAIVELRRAAELEPYFALPHVILGQLYERAGDGPKALAAYEYFLAHASQHDAQRDYAVERRKAVKDVLDFKPGA